MTGRAAVVIAMLVLAACQSTAEPGLSCERTAECSASLVCRSGRCRRACVETRDCPVGSECIPAGDGSAACAVSLDRCAGDTDCPAPLICGPDATCRAACLSDTDCTTDGACVLAGRLVCVARPAPAPSTCRGLTNDDFATGLSGWCVEASPGLDASVVRSTAAGFDGHAVEIDLSNAPVGAWARLYQEIPLAGRETRSFNRVSAAVDGATTMVAIELVDADGFVLGRISRAVAGDGTSDCTETGRPSAQCFVEPFTPVVTMSPALASAHDYANVDLRRVAFVRQVIELARTGAGSASLVIDGVSTLAAPCPLGWWRSEPHVGSFDLDDPTSPPSAFTTNDAPLSAFELAKCGQALTLDGTQSIDWMGALPEVYTASFDWYGTVHGLPLDGLSFVHELGGDVDVSVIAGQIVLSGCGVSVRDSARIVAADTRWQEMQVLVDRTAGRLCLARSGHRVGCVAAPACVGTPRPSGLRFAEADAPLHDRMAIDEIRIDDGNHVPGDDATRSGSCTLDLACHEATSLELRDVGSGQCVPTSTCTSTYVCPEAAGAADPALCGVTSEIACVIDETCPFGVRPCDGSPCTSLRLERCTQPLADACP